MAFLVMKVARKEVLMTRSLFDEPPAPYDAPEVIAPGAVLLRGFACDKSRSTDSGHRAGYRRRAAAPFHHARKAAGSGLAMQLFNLQRNTLSA